MIFESHPWRDDLKRFSRSLAKARATPLVTETQSARVERDIMYGFFAVRKLEESHKLTRNTERRKLKWIRYPAIAGRRMPRHRRQELNEYFDLQKPEKVDLSARELANQVIHSYVFVHIVDRKERLQGVYVTSDYGQNKGVLYVPAWRIVKLFHRVAVDEPTWWRWTYDSSTGAYLYSAGK